MLYRPNAREGVSCMPTNDTQSGVREGSRALIAAFSQSARIMIRSPACVCVYVGNLNSLVVDHSIFKTLDYGEFHRICDRAMTIGVV